MMCKDCEKKRFRQKPGPASGCGHMTHQTPMMFCGPCAKAKKACACCGKALKKK